MAKNPKSKATQRANKKAAQRAANKPPKSSPLSTLPTELLATIIELVLPEDIPSTYAADLKDYSSHIPPDMQYRNRYKPPRDPTRYAIAYINKRFHACAVRILRARPFRIEIDEMSFHEAPERAADKHWWYEMCGPLSGYEKRWRWHHTFPGLDLREIPELVNRHLAVQRGELLVFGDQRDDLATEIEREVAWMGDVELYELPEKGIVVDDYEKVLEVFEEVAKRAGECEVRLPYWVERGTEWNKEFLETWREMGVRVVFIPLAKSSVSRADEAEVRARCELVALWEEEEEHD